jgi:hypothetical protein
MQLYTSRRDRSYAGHAETGLTAVLLVIAFAASATFIEHFVRALAG